MRRLREVSGSFPGTAGALWVRLVKLLLETVQKDLAARGGRLHEDVARGRRLHEDGLHEEVLAPNLSRKLQKLEKLPW